VHINPGVPADDLDFKLLFSAPGAEFQITDYTITVLSYKLHIKSVLLRMTPSTCTLGTEITSLHTHSLVYIHLLLLLLLLSLLLSHVSK
jgi:hypothetical protein